MKLYYSRGACSLAVRITLHEIGLFSEFEAVDLVTKKTESGADYLKINPKGMVPVLDCDGKILTENAVIHQYLAETHKENRLLPPVGDEKRYHVLEWLNFASSDFHKSCGPLFNPNVPDEIKQTVFLPLLKKKVDFLNQSLEKNKYLAGDEYTLPDAYVFTVLRWMPKLGVNLADYPNVTRYFNEMKQRKSVATALTEEGLK